MTRDGDTAFAATAPVSGETSATQPGEGRRADDVSLAVGVRIGERYVVRALLGRGGMGAVYRALDDKLGEEVALKAVRASERVRDEVRLAQKVTHPNVCRTYDLLEIEGHTLVKMEHIAGETLAVRLASRGKLSIGETLRIARAICDGLAAAHAQGIAHRDLKPGNVMLAGQRVLLMDFGVASQIEDPIAAVAGTLGYMAPEQLANTHVDSRADLYGLGCVVYEMLAGAAVFGTGKPLEIAARHASQVAPDVRLARPETPRWLARAVAALLAKDPGDRPAGLARLREGPRRVKRSVLAVALALVVAGGGAFALARDDRSAPCSGAEARLGGIWDAPSKLRAHQRFLATKLPYAERSYQAVERSLDEYTGAWTAMAIDSCRATRVRREQPEEVLALRAQCLDLRLAELRALSRLLGEADAGIVEKGDRLVQPLFQLLPTCENVAALRSSGWPPPDVIARLPDLEEQLALARVQWLAGNLLAAMTAGTRVEATARELRWEPFIAEGLEIRGYALIASGNFTDGVQALQQATWAAMRGHRDDIAARDAYSVAGTMSDNLGKPDEAQVWIDLGDAASARAGNAHVLALMGYLAAGVVAAERGDLLRATELHQRALAESQLLYGKSDELQALTEASVAATWAKAGGCGRALVYYEHALAAREKVDGPDHPEIALMLSNLGDCYLHVGQLDKARATLERTVRLRERFYGARNPILLAPLDNLAEVLEAQGEHAAALPIIDRAKRIGAFVPGTAHPTYHIIATTYAQVLISLGRTSEGHAAFDEVIAQEHAAHSSSLPETLTLRAKLALAEHQPALAKSLAEEAIASLETAGGHEQPMLWHPLTLLGQAEHAAGANDEARAHLERALAIAGKAQIPDYDLRETRDALASLAR